MADEQQPVETLREALENTNSLLRRLSKVVKDTHDGNSDGELIATSLRRARRRLRANRELLAAVDEGGTSENNRRPAGAKGKAAGKRRQGGEGDAKSAAVKPRRARAGARKAQAAPVDSETKL